MNTILLIIGILALLFFIFKIFVDKITKENKQTPDKPNKVETTIEEEEDDDMDNYYTLQINFISGDTEEIQRQAKPGLTIAEVFTDFYDWYLEGTSAVFKYFDKEEDQDILISRASIQYIVMQRIEE
jgi:hypothetical protein